LNRRKILCILAVLFILNTGMLVDAAEYTVVKGNTLCDISQEVYGVQTMWRDIYEVNKMQIADPNVIYIGQVLVLPDNYYKDVTPEDVAGIDEAIARDLENK